MSGNYWLSTGPITKAEEKKAFDYLRKHNKPADRRSDAFRNFIAKLRKRREVNRYLRSKNAANAEPSAPWEIIYGDMETGGVITFRHTSGPDSNDPNKYQHLIITIAAHEIYRIRKVYFDHYEVSWDTDLLTRPTGQVNATGIFDGLVRMQINYGSTGQSALSVPVGDSSGHNPVSAKWTSNHRQRGHAHVYFRLTYNENIFKNGAPDITFLVQGKNDVVDPRTSSASPGAANVAMVLYDYMTSSKFGLGLSSSDFDSTRLNQAVSDCEDAIALAAGGTENRYLCNTRITADESPGAIIDELVASMAGKFTYTAGKFNLYAGKARSSVITITEDMILSELQVITKTPRIDNFNSVRGTFVSNQNSYEESDFPAVTNSTYVTEDGGTEIFEDLTFSMVTSHTGCQRLAKIELEHARQGIYVEFTATLAAYQAEPGEWVALTFSRFGWSAKLFEVVRSTLQIEQSSSGAPMFTVQLTLKETATGIYDWNSGNETTFDLAPNTDLPDPFTVVAPTGLSIESGTDHLYIRSDGTVFSRMYVTWTGAADTFVRNGGYYEVQFKCDEMGIPWTDAGDVPGSSTSSYILDVKENEFYGVRIRSVNALGARSSWLDGGHTVIGKTEPPSDVTSFSAIIEGFGIKFTWAKVSDLDVKEYEIRYGTTSQTWADCTVLARVAADRFYADNFIAGSYRFRIKAVDTTGNYSTNDRAADLTVSAPSAPQNAGASQIDNNVLIRWEAPASTVFPIAYYKVFRQDAATLLDLGRVTGTFVTYVELLSGAYTYRISAVDTAGNEGTAATVTTTIYSPPDFVLRSTSQGDLSTATLSNAVYTAETFSIDASANTEETFEDHFVNNSFDTIQDFIDATYSFWLEPLTGGTGTTTFTTTEGSVWAPANTTETWADHFTNNGVTTVQGLIDIGLTHWLLPNGMLTGTVAVVIDLGEVLPQTVVNFDYIAFGSGIQPVPRVSWREDSGDPWTDGQLGSKKATPSNYRYLKLTLTVTPQTSLDWCVITDPSVTVQVKEITDSGTTAVSSGDVGGTTVSFTKSFLDVSAIVVSPQGTTELKPVVDFTDAPNPTSFKVLLFNSAGARASGTIRWNARGVQAVI